MTSEKTSPQALTAEAIQSFVAERVASWLGIPPEQVDTRASFFDYSLDSVALLNISGDLEVQLGRRLSPTLLWEHPTIEEIARHLGQAALAAPPPAAPRPLAEERTFPLSRGQRALHLAHELAPDSGALNISVAVEVHSTVDVGALRGALQRLVDRHAQLRVTFGTHEGAPVQRVQEQVRFSLGEEDVGDLEDAALRARVTKEAHRPFRLSEAPLLAASLFRRQGRAPVLLLRVHHLVMDFWSLVVLVDELRVLYSAERSGTPVELPPATSYAAFVRWQEEMLAGPEGTRLWEYWQRQLGGSLPVLNLPLDKTRPTARSFRGGSHPVRVAPEVATRLKRLAQEEGTTPFTVLLAAYQVLLHRYSRQEDLLVGSPTAGRTQGTFAGTVGYFVNPVVLRANLAGNPGFRELVRQLKPTVRDALEHQEYPFPQLVERLLPVREPGRSPLFQALFVLEKPQLPSAQRIAPLVLGGTAGPVELGELRLSFFPLEQQQTQFDITLQMVEADGGFEGALQYNSDLFEPGTARLMARHLEVLLAGASASPEGRLSELPLFDAEERETLVTRWNDTATAFDRNACVQDVVAAQAERTPEAVAVLHGERTLTYKELERRANQLAWRLRRMGVGPETLVGLCVERSVEMVVALLGILKAGGAYVPLDPEYPADRLAFMLADSGAPVVVTQAHLRATLPEGSAQVLVLDAGWEELAQESDARPEHGATADTLAYVIYTSGSTGTPKGVCIPHRGIARLLLETDYIQLGPRDCIAQASNCSFDAATFEIWGALFSGARLVIVPKETVLSAQRFVALLREQRVTTLFLTTALFNELSRQVPDAFRTLDTVLFGGEAVDVRQVRAVLEKGAPRRLLHVYGPTETTTYASWHLVTEVPPEAATLPIGKPLANTELYVLDPSGQPAPIGVPGELHIGGPGLARGYLRRPELTAERFVASPLSPTGRLYRTGDLVRQRPDGAVEFLGRIDGQVKVRGFRIELGEVQAALLRHPAVKEAEVLAREDVPGERRLVAYVVSPGTTAGELRAALRKNLPDYMVPSAFVLLDVLPLNPNGKVDKPALPAPPRDRGEEAYVAPRTALEETVAKLWAEVLGLDRVGIQDDFFALGGHSLLATQLISRIREQFSVELPLRDLFESPTVEALARAIEHGQKPQLSSIPRLSRDAHRGRLPTVKKSE